jgi:hypothetical protein
MRLIIAGGRDYQLTEADYLRLDAIHERYCVVEVFSGGATGADECGKQWAAKNDIVFTCYPADWKNHGKAAGPIRNRQMANEAQAVALFPGGRGTESMWKEADAAGIRIFDFRKSGQ